MAIPPPNPASSSSPRPASPAKSGDADAFQAALRDAKAEATSSSASSGLSQASGGPAPGRSTLGASIGLTGGGRSARPPVMPDFGGASALGGPARSAGTAAAGLAPEAPSSADGQDWGAALGERAQAWLGDITAAAEDAGVDPKLLASVVKQESQFTPDAVSDAGAVGLSQLMPATAEVLGVDPSDPQQNLKGGARHLRAMLDRYGSVEEGLAAYNAGPGRVDAAGGIPDIAETQHYVATVTDTYAQLGGAA